MKDSSLELVRTDLAYALRMKIQKVMSKLSSKFHWRDFRSDQFEIERVQVAIQKLPASFKNYRIVHISDIHYGQWISSDRLDGVVEIINEICPDLVAITGDFVSYVLDESVRDMAMILGKLNPKDQTVAVLGNHDYWAGAEKVRQILKKGGICDVTNDVFAICRADSRLYIAGVDSASVKRDRLDIILEKLPIDGPAILLVHEPDFAVKSAKTKRFSLQLSGHSHGGQFIIPMIGPLFRGNLFMKYPAGQYEVGGMKEYTNRGLGTNTYWLRVNCKPEITVITLI
jgi:uncharacterized protein